MNSNTYIILCKRIYILLSFAYLYNVNCFIKIPFIYYPSKLNNKTDPQSTILSILELTMYGILEIGTPKQIINIPIRFGSNTFFLPQKSSYYYNENDNLKLYDDKNSTSFQIIKNLDYFEGENFIEALYVNDIFYFEKEKINLDFYLSTSYYFPQIGGLGLQLYPSNKMNTATPSIDKTFLRKLKIKGLINNYIWSIFFNTSFIDKKGKYDGYILIGDYPHLSNEFLMEENYNYSLNSIEAKIYERIVETAYTMDNIFIYNDNENNIIKELNFENNTINVKLDYNFGGILAPKLLRIYLDKKIFNNNNY